MAVSALPLISKFSSLAPCSAVSTPPFITVSFAVDPFLSRTVPLPLMLVLLTLAPLLTSKPFAAVEPEELTIVSAAVPLTVMELVPFNVVPTAEAPAAMVILEESLATVLLMEPPF